jgi:spore germination protein GerM
LKFNAFKKYWLRAEPEGRLISKLWAMTDGPDLPVSEALSRAIAGWARNLLSRLPETVELSVQIRVSSGLVVLIVALAVLLWR